MEAEILSDLYSDGILDVSIYPSKCGEYFIIKNLKLSLKVEEFSLSKVQLTHLVALIEFYKFIDIEQKNLFIDFFNACEREEVMRIPVIKKKSEKTDGEANGS